ncbi:MAG: thioredoxin-disulfide reductase [Clostridiales bacterium]|jgi:thioredoxin reductase (NADPH)|nr:thioredoxin-disulfide reductase [Clostridiales bacterium]
MPKTSYDIIIIGAGCAGLTAAVYARRAGKSVLLLERETFGGQIAFSPKVENYPAVPSASGEELSNNMFEQATGLGADTELETVLEIIPEGSTKKVLTDYGEYTCKALIAATGMKHRHMGLANENELIGKGVSYCAVCDGVFYKDRDAVVFGGGDTALQDALFLSEFCKSVTVVHRRKEFRGEKWLVDALKKRKNVNFVLDNIVSELIGDKKLDALVLTNTVTGEKTQLPADALFVAIGQLPQTEVFKGLIQIDSEGFIIAGEDCRTSLDGIFVAGDCRTKQIRQLTTAAADGAVAALSACKYIDQNNR